MSHRVIVVASGDATPAEIAAAVGEDAAARPLVIAADGGALLAEAAGVRPDLVVGDGDSLSTEDKDRLRAAGVPLSLVSPEKEESDTELAFREAVTRGASEITLLAALGGPRPEHATANLLLLAHPMLDGLEVRLVAGASVIRRMGTADGPGALTVTGAPDDWVSLEPLDTLVEGVTTDGLRYPLADEPLLVGPTRGLSNELLGTDATVTTRRGRLLVTHTRRVD